MGLYCDCMPTCTPESGYHGITKLAKNANIPKTAKSYINRISARPTLLHTTLWGLDHKTLFRLEIEKYHSIHEFGPSKKRGGGYCFNILDPTPGLPPSPSSKSGFQVKGGRGVRTKN